MIGLLIKLFYYIDILFLKIIMLHETIADVAFSIFDERNAARSVTRNFVRPTRRPPRIARKMGVTCSYHLAIMI